MAQFCLNAKKLEEMTAGDHALKMSIGDHWQFDSLWNNFFPRGEHNRHHVDAGVKEDAVRLGIKLLETIIPDPDRLDMSVLFWDGTTWGSPERSAFTLVLRHPGGYQDDFSPRNELRMGEAYIYDDCDIEGDVEAAYKVGISHLASHLSPLRKLRLWPILWHLPKAARHNHHRAHLKGAAHSKKRDREAISYHYDVSNDFYSLWLDQNLVYSCAYYESANDTLDAAQANKLDYVP